MEEALLPEDTTLLGASSAPFAIRGEESSALVRLSAEGQHRVVTLLAGAGRARRGRVFLMLEHLRGSHDAAVLNVYVGRPADTTSRRLVGTWALFGLRTASLGHTGTPGQGLNASFDITSWLAEAPGTPVAEVNVHIVPTRALPGTTDLIVEHISLHYLPAN